MNTVIVTMAFSKTCQSAGVRFTSYCSGRPTVGGHVLLESVIYYQYFIILNSACIHSILKITLIHNILVEIK